MSAHGRSEALIPQREARRVVQLDGRPKSESFERQREGGPVNAGCRVRIVGLGSPHGDDRAGWAVVATLGDTPLPPGVELRTCATPATELLPALRGANRVILVDAVAGGEPGTILRGDRGALVDRGAGLSSHGIALGMLLDLANTCGLLPPELTWIGVAVDPARAEGESFSAPVAAALPALARAAIEEALR